MLVAAAVAAVEADDPREVRAVAARLDALGLLDYDAFDPLNRTLLHHALDGGHVRASRALLDAGVDPRALDYLRRTPLMNAVFDLGLFRRLLPLSVPTTRDQYAETALHHAAQDLRSKVAVVRLLLDAGVPVDGRDTAGRTALHFAAACAEVPKIDALLAAGADPHVRARGELGTPLEFLSANVASVPVPRKGDVDRALARLRRAEVVASSS